MVKNATHKQWSHEKLLKKLSSDYHNLLNLLNKEEGYDDEFKFIHKYNNSNDYYFSDWVNEIQEFIINNYDILHIKNIMNMKKCLIVMKIH